MIVCTECQLQYKTVKIGTALEVMTQDNEPYRLFAGDRLECPGCGHRIVRTGSTPIVEQYEATYKSFVGAYERSETLDRAWISKKEKDKAHGAG